MTNKPTSRNWQTDRETDRLRFEETEYFSPKRAI